MTDGTGTAEDYARELKVFEKATKVFSSDEFHLRCFMLGLGPKYIPEFKLILRAVRLFSLPITIENG